MNEGTQRKCTESSINSVACAVVCKASVHTLSLCTRASVHLKGGWWGVTVLSAAAAAAVGQPLLVQAEESKVVNNTQ